MRTKPTLEARDLRCAATYWAVRAKLGPEGSKAKALDAARAVLRHKLSDRRVLDIVSKHRKRALTYLMGEGFFPPDGFDVTHEQLAALRDYLQNRGTHSPL